MSGGEQQMLAIGRALMSSPRILLVDEPSVGLAPILVSRVIGKIKELKERRQLTVLMAEQNFNQATKIADRGYIIVHGKIEFEGRSTHELRENELSTDKYTSASDREVSSNPMIVPLAEGLPRARRARVRRARGVVDEPSPPGGGLGRFTYAQFGAMARSLAVASTTWASARTSAWPSSPERRALPGEPVRRQRYGRILVPVNFRLNAEEIRYILGHSGSSVLLVDPSWTSRCATSRSSTASCWARRAMPHSSGARVRRQRLSVRTRTPRRRSTTPSGTTARPKGVQLTAPQLLAQRGDLRLAPGPQRSRRLSAHAADVPLQRLGACRTR
jgi:ABC-type lipoprotein export system ATPase subunit